MNSLILSISDDSSDLIRHISNMLLSATGLKDTLVSLRNVLLLNWTFYDLQI